MDESVTSIFDVDVRLRFAASVLLMSVPAPPLDEVNVGVLRSPETVVEPVEFSVTLFDAVNELILIVPA